MFTRRVLTRRWCAAVVVALAGCSVSGAELPLERAAVVTTTTSTTLPVSTTTTPALPAVTAPTAVAAVRGGAWSLGPYVGLGAWLDAFDWSVTFAGAPERTVGVEAIDHMAAEGVQTLYIQASRWNSPTDVLEPERLQVLIDRAHGHGIAVIVWYLPTLVDLELDQRRLLALAELPVDGLAVDIESREVADVAERNRRLLALSAVLDEALGDRTLGAVVIEPVVMEDVNPRYWPGFPWVDLAEHYDVWLPMGYWTNRRDEWRSAYTYTGTNIARIRERIGQPDAPVHAIGGIGSDSTIEDLQGMVQAVAEQAAIGGSIYDYRTSRAEFWEILRALRR